MTPFKTKILIVDDAGPVVVLCVNVLQALGYAVKGEQNDFRPHFIVDIAAT